MSLHASCAVAVAGSVIGFWRLTISAMLLFVIGSLAARWWSL